MSVDVDVVVIGSGAGGLTAAVALAQAGRKVLVLEQHYVPGGLCHSFTLEGYRFNTGVHYLGEFGPDGIMRRIYEGLGVSRDVQFCEANPEGIDHLRLGRERFDVPKGRAAFAAALARRFPGEAAGIDALLRTCEAMAAELQAVIEARGPRAALRAVARATTVRRLAATNGRSLVDRFVSDPLLKAFLDARCGNHGLPPSRVAAIMHAALLNHYFGGAYYPIGGGANIARAFVRALERAGGTIRLSTRVDRILVERGRAIGVRLADGTEVRARHVVSNADPTVTFGRLLEPRHVPWWTRGRLRRTRYSLSTLSLYLAVGADLRALGMDSGNFWLLRDADIERAFRDSTSPPPGLDARMDGLFVTAPSLKDPTKRREGVHTIEVFRFISHAPFAKYAGTAEGSRGPEYAALKERLMDTLLDTIEDHIPGVRAHVVFRALGTPLTNEFYTCATAGHTYGTEKSTWQVGPFGFTPRSGIDGLSLCGASTFAHGIAGATRSGLMAARGVLDCEWDDLLRAGGPPLEVYPSEDLSQWPERLRTKIDRKARPKAGADPLPLPQTA